MKSKPINPSKIISVGIYAISWVQQSINNLLRDKESIFGSVKVLRTGKTVLEIDLTAEQVCQSILYDKFGKNIEVYGEEKLANNINVDLSSEERLIALIDMVDGSDLLKRGLSNWCSAITFYSPSQAKILGAFVGIPSDGIYYAMENEQGVYKKLYKKNLKIKGARVIKLRGTSETKKLNEASVCFYGQKINKFLSVSDNQKFIDRLKKLGKDPETRIYNFGGNPMMVKLAEGHIDAVFDLKGQYPHDVAPGAFIAKKAGAVFKDLKGNNIDLMPALLKPAESKIKYILASTPSLFKNIQSAIS